MASVEGRSLSIDRLTAILKDSNLWRLHTGIFTANTTLRALFVVIPFFLKSFLGNGREWLVYLSVLLVSGLIMFPTIFVAERKGKIQEVLMISVGILSTGLFVFLIATGSFTGLVVALTLYFVGFSLIEAILPSLVTRIAGESERGTAMGLFNMSQYLGAFAGSIFGGFFLQTTEASTSPHATPWLFGALIVLVMAWSLFLKGLSVKKST